MVVDRGHWGMSWINHIENRKIAITFRWQPKALQVASERTRMEEAVPNRNILVSKFRLGKVWNLKIFEMDAFVLGLEYSIRVEKSHFIIKKQNLCTIESNSEDLG